MESQPALHIQLLGTFRLTYRGQLVRNVLTKRLVALLAYLLIHRKESIPRQRLAYLFWPDTGDSQARTNLRRLLHQLREAFPSINDYLHSEPTCLSWNHGAPYRLDIAEFEMAAEQARDIPDLQKAIDLYEDNLLPDLYEDWVQSERERLGRVYEDLLVRLAHLEEGNGYYQSAVRTGQRLLQHDPLREETYRLLMRLHSRMGDRTGVRRVYNTCKAVLLRELEVGPEPETETAYQTWFQAVASLPLGSDRFAPNFRQKKTNLPAFLDPLIGRREDLEQVKTLVISKRLVTLTGFGGVGKTRLALAAVAELQGEYLSGIYWIDLAQLENSSLLSQVFADALGVQVDNRNLLEDRLIEFIVGKRMLLVVDNCEHLIEAVGHFIEQVLTVCQELHILTTSRISLRIPGETIYQVQPLPVPTLSSQASAGPGLRIESLQQNASVKLFVDRARSILPPFSLNEGNQETVAQICRRLDGIPLALELAAGRIRLLDPKGIAERLDRVFHLLAGGKNSLPRHQTLQATLDWSYALLSDQEQILLRRLAVFAGSFTLEDAETVTQGGGLPSSEVLERLAGLIDHSLVAIESVDDERYYRLHEVTRQYAHMKLDDFREIKDVYSRHAKFFAQLAEEAEANVWGGQEPISWLQRLESEHGNLRAALDWCLSGGDQSLGMQLAGSLTSFWVRQDHQSEGHKYIEWALQISDHAPTSLKAKLYLSSGWMAYVRQDLEACSAVLQKAASLYREVNDPGNYGWTLVFYGCILGMLHTSRYAEAISICYEGLDILQKINDKPRIAQALNAMGAMERINGNYEKAKAIYEACLPLSREIGDLFREMMLYQNLGFIAVRRGDYLQAQALSRRSLQLSFQTKSPMQFALSLISIGGLCAAQSNAELGARLMGAAQEILEAKRLVLQPDDVTEMIHYQSNLREQLGEAAYEELILDGRQMKLEDVLALVKDH